MFNQHALKWLNYIYDQNFRLVLKKPKDEIENLVNHLKVLIIISLGFLAILFIFDLYYAISFAISVENSIDAECLSDVISLSPAGCKDMVQITYHLIHIL